MSLYYKIKRRLFPVVEGNAGFIPQFRLEGRSREGDSKTGLEMRTSDPLWMLGRQWQFGEFLGEDNGSPISARTNFRKERPNFYSYRGDEKRHEIGNIPLEAHVEAVNLPPRDLRSKVRIGQKFEGLITRQFSSDVAEDLIRRLRVSFPLKVVGEVDQKSLAFFNLMKGKVVDGGDLWVKIQQDGFPNSDFPDLDSVTKQLETWYQKLYVVQQKDASWKSHHLVHDFSVHGEQGLELHAPDYQSGHLDWHSFDRSNVKINPRDQSTDSDGSMPVEVSFAGMPDKRLYAFEDSHLDLSNMEVDRSDLVKLMIIDFALVPTKNWFLIPLEMEIGEICWVNHIVVKDVFGISTVIHHDNDTGQYLNANPLKTWDAFKIRPLDLLRERSEKNQELYERGEQFVYLPPTTTFRQESRPLEDILFIRDEYANMVWAIEKTICDAGGKPVNGHDLHLEINGPFQNLEERENNVPLFRLASPVPTNWIPYLPFHIQGSSTQIELHRAVMMRNETNIRPEDIEPISHLAQRDLLRIREEAIPRAGIRVQLTKQRVRGADGSTYIWVGRKVLAGKGEGSSGLKFDQLLY